MEAISASDLERFAYCPLSWWLSTRSDVTSPVLEEGEREHKALSVELSDIMEEEKRARNWERVVLWFALTATVLAAIGVVFRPLENSSEWSKILGLLSIPWVISAVFMLYRSASAREERKRSQYEQVIVIFAIIAMVITLNSVTVLGVDPEIAMIYEVAALIWLIGASVALYVSLSASQAAIEKRRKKDIEGEIRYVGRRESRLLKSDRYGLSGRPDYILLIDGELVPVDVKTGRQPRGPLFSHILRVAAYCLLLSEDEGVKVTHGILKYDNIEHEIEFDDETKRLLISKLDEMRNLMTTQQVHRNHNRAGKCRSCSRRSICPERLA
ncbi:MAG: CRISPR-associated protein Cas4 [Methanomassiliicoccales archaeon]|nr:CRISPR-associated protein Cas4 [Methanomassiliicoccales archaeon]